MKRRQCGCLAVLAVLVVAIFLQAGTASARVGLWYQIPSYGNLEGNATIDYVTGTSSSVSRTAYGRVQLILRDSTAVGRIEYAPFARFAADGGWNALPTYRGRGSVVLSWRDTFHLAYEGFKFRLCGVHYCGRQSYIYFR